MLFCAINLFVLEKRNDWIRFFYCLIIWGFLAETLTYTNTLVIFNDWPSRENPASNDMFLEYTKCLCCCYTNLLWECSGSYVHAPFLLVTKKIQPWFHLNKVHRACMLPYYFLKGGTTFLEHADSPATVAGCIGMCADPQLPTSQAGRFAFWGQIYFWLSGTVRK